METRSKKQTVGRVEKTQRAFTLLLAVLVSSVLIALGSAIYDIVSKEIVLSAAGRESQFSFYAADTGVECALYHDFKNNLFGTSSTATTVTCGGSTVNIVTPRPHTNIGVDDPADVNDETLITQFSFPIGGTEQTLPCASITVTRKYTPMRTTVESAGYNTCVTTSPNRLERAIRVNY
ncbi:hypothetical protein K2X83_03125 [Patescibacteria group bacterium]|nr:hypothetical protein [Patescibacteria group bacterium]